MNIALFVIDMQKTFFKNNSKTSIKNASEYIDYTIDLFRRNNKKNFWIQDEDIEDGVIEGTNGFDIIDILKPKTNEKHIKKHYGNSFNKTCLLENLLKDKINTIIITGFCAENCILSTYRGALDHDLVPIILRKAIASGSKENLKFVENISDIITIKVLEKIIQEK